MTIDDANDLLGTAAGAYSYAFRGMSTEQKVQMVQSWAFGLQDIPADIVMLAFMQLTTTSKWIPTVAEIRERVLALRAEAADQLDAEESARRVAIMLGKEPPRPEDPTGDAVRRYIVENTKHLSAKTGQGLGLDKILEVHRYMTALGSGKMGFAAEEIQGGTPFAGTGIRQMTP